MRERPPTRLTTSSPPTPEGRDNLAHRSISTLTRRRREVGFEGEFVYRAIPWPPRVAFRDVTNRTNSRTILACLVPPGVFLTNKAPYLAFVNAGPEAQAACLGIMNSLPFDWQARRFIEINVNFFLLEGLYLPDLSDADFNAISHAAARLSAVDDRFADFAAATGVEYGPLTPTERTRLRVEIDARVCRTWELTADDLEVVFADFTEDAVTPAYRTAVVERLGRLR